MHISPFSNNLCFRLTLLYHGLHCRTSVLFSIHLPPAEEGEFLLYYVKRIKQHFSSFFLPKKLSHTPPQSIHQRSSPKATSVPPSVMFSIHLYVKRTITYNTGNKSLKTPLRSRDSNISASFPGFSYPGNMQQLSLIHISEPTRPY